MSFDKLNDIIINNNFSIKSVLKKIEKTSTFTGGQGFVIVVDEDGICIGVVTDGDIRRKILDEVSINEPIKIAVNKNFTFVQEGEPDHVILRKFDKNIFHLPVLNIENKPVDLYQYSQFSISSRFDEKIIRARSPVRVSFSGGGTDMTNYFDFTDTAVFSCTINKHCTASILKRSDNEIHIYSKNLDLRYAAKNINNIEYGDVLDLIKAAIKVMAPDFGFDIELYAEFEPGTGLGGSSAVVLSVLGALNYFRNEKHLDKYQLADVAYQVERIDLKMSGGWQDQYASVFGGFNWILFREKDILVTPVRINSDTLLELEYNLMLFRIGKQRSSSKIQKQHIQSISNDKFELKLLNKMKNQAVKIKEALLKGKLKKFGDLLHESWILKKDINDKVTNDYIEDCYNTAIKFGALGGKLLGAGGGGYLLIYCSPRFQDKVKLELEEKKLKFEPFKFCSNGLEVWSTQK